MVFLSAWILIACGILTPTLSLSWTHKHLTEKISIRLVKRDWKPLGPSSNTDEVMDEYKWDVMTAYDSLKKSKYEYVEAPLLKTEQLFQDTRNYDSQLDSIIIIHPILSNADQNFPKTTTTALAMRNLHKQYNIFVVNMGPLGKNLILSCVYHTLGLPHKYDIVAEYFSLFLLKGIDLGKLQPEQIHLVGQSYSGQLVGYIARYINLLKGRKIGSVLALDPYTNSLNQHMVQVSKEDAQIVHVYHTNSWVMGTRERLAHADFVFNSGNKQPECSMWKVLKGSYPEPLCSHSKVIPRVWYVILFPSKFVARHCVSWNRLTSCLCEKNPTAVMKYPFPKDMKASGLYYIRTSYTKPYGLGPPGSSCTPDMATKALNNLKVVKTTARRRLG